MLVVLLTNEGDKHETFFQIPFSISDCMGISSTGIIHSHSNIICACVYLGDSYLKWLCVFFSVASVGSNFNSLGIKFEQDCK